MLTEAALTLADALISQGLQFWIAQQQKRSEGTLTLEDVQMMKAVVDANLAQLAKDVQGMGNGK